MEVVDSGSFLEWLAEAYKDFGANLEFVSDRSGEGNQFVKGFGGIGAILRYKVNFEQLADYSDDDEFYDGMFGLLSPTLLQQLTCDRLTALPPRSERG
jgi:peptide chain release factor subunit 1